MEDINGHTFILAPCHVCNELIKLHGLEFYCRKIFIEEAKTPPKTLLNELSTSTVANDQQNMHKMPPTINDVRSRLPKHLQKNKVQFRTLAVHIPMQLYQRRKALHFFGQYTSRDENETSKFPGEGRKNTLKSIPWRQSQ